MVEIQCPHCDGDIELEDDVFGLFDCPHCDEEFTWDDDSDSEHSENNVSKSNANEVAKVGFGLLICAVLAWPVLPEILGIYGWEVLGWIFAAFVILCIGLVVLLVAGIMKFLRE
jgi:hypothetical protein